MRTIGVVLVWAAKISGILVGANLGILVKQYLTAGQEDMVFYTSLLHGLFCLPVFGLYRMGTWCKARAERTAEAA